MKIRNGFVSNSSSSSFLITNKGTQTKTLIDFVKETPHLVEEYNYHYRGKYTQKQLLKNAEKENIIFEPGETKECIFGDEQGTFIGCVYDYILRDGGTSRNFNWQFSESLR